MVRRIVRKVISLTRRRRGIVALLVILVALCLLVKGFAYKIPSYLNVRVLELLVSMMIISRGFELSGALSRLALYAIKVSRGDVRIAMQLMIVWTAVVSSILMNDTSLFVFVPIAVALSRVCGIRKVNAVALTVIAANVGSQLTPIGNPQNMIIWSLAQVPFQTFVFRMAIPTLACLALLHLYSLPMVWRRARVPIPPKTALNRVLVLSAGIALVATVLIEESSLWYLSIIPAIVLVITFRRYELHKAIDVGLIALFALIFIDFGGIGSMLTGLRVSVPFMAIPALGIALSQAISNVPATMILIHWVGTKYWYQIAISCNIAGNGTIVSSLANLIAANLGDVKYRDLQVRTLPYLLITIPLAMIFSLSII